MHFISSFKIYYFTSDRLVRQLLNTAVIVSWLAIDSAEVRARDVTKFVHGNKGGKLSRWIHTLYNGNIIIHQSGSR